MIYTHEMLCSYLKYYERISDMKSIFIVYQGKEQLQSSIHRFILRKFMYFLKAGIMYTQVVMLSTG